MRDWGSLKLEEVLDASMRITVCPKCGAKEGFWLGFKRDHAYVQCKGCGASFELYQVYPLNEKSGKKTLKDSKFLGK